MAIESSKDITMASTAGSLNVHVHACGHDGHSASLHVCYMYMFMYIRIQTSGLYEPVNFYGHTNIAVCAYTYMYNVMYKHAYYVSLIV